MTVPYILRLYSYHNVSQTKTEPAETVKICQQLLDQRDVEVGCRAALSGAGAVVGCAHV